MILRKLTGVFFVVLPFVVILSFVFKTLTWQQVVISIAAGATSVIIIFGSLSSIYFGLSLFRTSSNSETKPGC